MKKQLAVILSAVLVISAIAVMPAIASDWPEFQKDEFNIGRTDDSAPINYYNLSEVVLWSHHTAHAGWSGIDTVPIVVDDYVYVLAADGSNAKLFKYSKSGTAAGGSWPVTVGSGSYQNSCPAYGEGKIFVLNSGDHTLHAVNATTGSKTSAATGWNTNPVTVGSYQLSCPITYYKDNNENFGRLFFGNCQDSANKYYCYNATDGTQLWEYTGAGKNYWAGCTVIGDYIVFGNDSGYVTSLNWTNGAYVDSLNVGGGKIRSSVAWNVSAADSNYGYIFFTNRTGYHLSKIGFNKSTGDEGHFNSSDWTGYNIRYSTSTPAVYNGRVYVGGGNFSTGDPALLCLNESDITDKKWDFTPNGAVQSSPALSIQGSDVYIYFTTNANNGTVYCIKDNGNSYEEKWKYTTEQTRSSGGYILQGVAISDGRVFFGNDGGYLYGINKTDRIHVYDFNDGAGTDKWAFRWQHNFRPPSTCDVPGTEFTGGSYNTPYYKIKIKGDGNQIQKDTTDANGNYSAHRFNFSIDETTADITAINVSWTGRGYHDSGGIYNGAYLYIYNFTSGGYGSAVASTDSSGSVTLIGGNESSASNYINSGNVTILVEQKTPQRPWLQGIIYHSHIWTDYVKLLVHTKA